MLIVPLGLKGLKSRTERLCNVCPYKYCFVLSCANYHLLYCYQLVLAKNTSCFSDLWLECCWLIIPSSEFQPLRWIKHTPLKCCILSQSQAKLTLKSLPFQSKQTEKQYEIWIEAMDTWLGWKNTTWKRTTRQDKTWLVFRTETDSIF